MQPCYYAQIITDSSQDLSPYKVEPSMMIAKVADLGSAIHTEELKLKIACHDKETEMEIVGTSGYTGKPY